jgi:CRISPR-associated endonuclease/helicase Cas3
MIYATEVIVKKIQRFTTEIKDKEYLSRKDYQKIAQYCVQVYEWFTKANANKISEISNGVKIWFGAYSKEIGLSNEDEIYYI